MVNSSKTIRTYMAFSQKVDPATILTMADLELSIALATPLVPFNDERQPVSALAEKWVPAGPNKMVFTLKPNLKWSDGSSITAQQYKECLERAAQAYPNELKALFDSINKIEAPDDRTLVFVTKSDVTKSGIVLKLTEPMYGLLRIKNGKPDLSVTAGPYVLKSEKENELVLSVNSHWYQYHPEMAGIVEIRRPAKGSNIIETFASDEWVNLASGSSLMKASVGDSIKSHHFKVWQRALDKVYSLYPSKAFIDRGGSEFIKILAQRLDKNKVLTGFSGFTTADQFFPRGYELWSMTPPKLEEAKATPFKSIKLLIIDGSVAAAVKENLSREIKEIASSNVDAQIVPPQEFEARAKAGNYDILATQIAVADPNFEGAMSYFFEREPAFIQSAKAPLDFAKQTQEARGLATSKERAQRMREIIIKAQEAGFVLPIFHFSSMAIAKKGVNLSAVPNSDETVLFSKVRME